MASTGNTSTGSMGSEKTVSTNTAKGSRIDSIVDGIIAMLFGPGLFKGGFPIY